MAVGKGSILRAGNASAAVKEKAAKETVSKERESKAAVPVAVKEMELVAKVPVEALKPVSLTWGSVSVKEHRVEALARSIGKHGLIVPVLVYKNKKQELFILKGNHRVAAAKAAGCKEVAVSFVEADNDAEARAIYEELRMFEATKGQDKEYEVVSSITVNMPSYLL